jgi:hypothetical protein
VSSSEAAYTYPFTVYPSLNLRYPLSTLLKHSYYAWYYIQIIILRGQAIISNSRERGVVPRQKDYP